MSRKKSLLTRDYHLVSGGARALVCVRESQRLTSRCPSDADGKLDVGSRIRCRRSSFGWTKAADVMRREFSRASLDVYHVGIANVIGRPQAVGYVGRLRVGTRG